MKNQHSTKVKKNEKKKKMKPKGGKGKGSEGVGDDNGNGNSGHDGDANIMKRKRQEEEEEEEVEEEREDDEVEKEEDSGISSNETADMKERNSNANDNNKDEDEDDDDDGIISKSTFASLGVCEPICNAITTLGWTYATKIQKQTLPSALSANDIIGLAETGSGKTGAFAIPILQSLLQNPQRGAVYAIILSPTRELAFQIHEVISALGSSIGCTAVCIVGGVDMTSQAIALARNPHVVTATPGRLVDHLTNTKGFHLRQVKYLVMDEADRMLSMDFEQELNQILEVVPDASDGRRTMLFSATMTSKVQKLQRASLHNPVRIEVSTKFQTPKKLLQNYLFIPAKYKDVYLTYLINDNAGKSILVFGATCNNVQRLALMLRNLGFPAVCLHGQMSQPKRLGALNKFKSGSRSILICTDVASRGLDIPSVDVVINFDLPGHGKDYIHRVGRTARAGRSGVAVAMVTQYDVEVYQRLEVLLGRKLSELKLDEETVLVLQERVSEAQRLATRELKEQLAALAGSGKGKRRKKGNRMGGGGAGGDDGDRDDYDNGGDGDGGMEGIVQSQMRNQYLASGYRSKGSKGGGG
eukprot:CAMPEP_0203672208 /NCGR_PEP_ID=MMETSP0090-20130426/7777_1 /ASSEMBLY_ACC=CAM_ASM_001088 /TAXON_ID=426623 /ORGANISM="Chaetoceros affinis, Strain CCMP159" /LENGTH=583 /DNA_ID=CAMNT_0050537475 /DNA_START=18 /DNA_END=1765 /DNA_ORIENTATION=-